MTIKTAEFTAKPPEPFSSSLEPSSNLFASLSGPISLTANDNNAKSNYSANQFSTSTSNTPSFPVNQNVTSTQPLADRAEIKVTTSCKEAKKRRLLGLVAGLFLFIILSSVLGSVKWPEDQQFCTALQSIEINTSALTKMKSAVDDNNLAVVASGSSGTQIIFYSRVNEWEWEYQTSFRENINNIDFNVVLSEDTVIVDFHEYNNMNNNIIMYELKSDGTWWKNDNFPIQNLPTNPFYYQPGLSLNGDLACVCRYNCHLYHRDEAATWTLAAIFDLGYQGCLIVGNAIALQDYNGDLSIYLYDETLVTASLVQDSIPAYYGFTMSHMLEDSEPSCSS